MPQPHTGDDRYRPLFETDRGCMLHCDCCGGLQLHFGNAILGLSASDFDPLRETIRALEQDATQWSSGPIPAERPRSGRERATIFVGETGIGFAFDADELGELHRLLEGARLFLDLQGSVGGPGDQPSSSEPEWR